MSRKIDMILVSKGGKLVHEGYHPKTEEDRVEILAALTELQRYMERNRDALDDNIAEVRKRRMALQK